MSDLQALMLKTECYAHNILINNRKNKVFIFLEHNHQASCDNTQTDAVTSQLHTEILVIGNFFF